MKALNKNCKTNINELYEKFTSSTSTNIRGWNRLTGKSDNLMGLIMLTD